LAPQVSNFQEDSRQIMHIMKWEFYKAKFFISILELVSHFSIDKAGSIQEFLQYYDRKNQMALEFNLNVIQNL
jgi:hypothetical protein